MQCLLLLLHDLYSVILHIVVVVDSAAFLKFVVGAAVSETDCG